MRISFAILLPALLTFCFAPPLGAQPPSCLIGIVFDPRGVPVEGAVVQLSWQLADSPDSEKTLTYLAKTDKRGHFGLCDIRAGKYSATIDKEGFSFVAQPITVVSGKAIILQAVPLATVPVRVLAPDGTPLSNKVVWLLWSSQNEHIGHAEKSKTDDNGLVVLRNAGIHSINVNIIAPEQGYGFKWAYTKSGLNETMEVLLKAGGTLNVIAQENPTSPGAPAQAVGGVKIVLDAEFKKLVQSEDEWNPSWELQRQMNRYLETLQANDYRFYEKYTDDRDGRIVFPSLPPGRYIVTMKAVAGQQSPPVTIEVKAGQTSTATLLVPPLSRAQLKVVLLHSDKKPVKNTELTIGVVKMVKGEMSHDDEISNLRVIRTNAAGRFSLYPMEAGKWTLTIRDQKFEVEIPAKGLTTTLMLK